MAFIGLAGHTNSSIIGEWNRPTAVVAVELWDVHGDWTQCLEEDFC